MIFTLRRLVDHVEQVRAHEAKYGNGMSAEERAALRRLRRIREKQRAEAGLPPLATPSRR